MHNPHHTRRVEHCGSESEQRTCRDLQEVIRWSRFSMHPSLCGWGVLPSRPTEKDEIPFGWRCLGIGENTPATNVDELVTYMPWYATYASGQLATPLTTGKTLMRQAVTAVHGEITRRTVSQKERGGRKERPLQRPANRQEFSGATLPVRDTGASTRGSLFRNILSIDLLEGVYSARKRMHDSHA